MVDEIKKIGSVKDVKNIFIQLFPIFFRRKDFLGVLSLCAYRIEEDYQKKEFEKYVKLNDDYFEAKFLLKRGLKVLNFRGYSYFINIYRGKIDMKRLVNYNPQNLYTIVFKDNEVELQFPVIYNLLYYTKNLGINAKVQHINGHDLVCYFRQANMNSVSVVVRKPNVTDAASKQRLIFWAKFLSLFLPSSNKVLLYEKESKKYEESAAYLFEQLIDRGYKDCSFVLSRNSLQADLVKSEYQSNIIWAHTFKHYLNYFRCKNFMGTESLPHIVELRTANGYVARKFLSKKYRFVFLQHGVMYMVSLDSEGRSFFIKGVQMPIDAKIVVSSQVEANHFIDYAGFSQDDLYITGLPFYDRTIKRPGADKITIMLTWRPWEYSTLAADYEDTGYYRIIRNIVSSVPAELQDKVCLLPHPLVADKLKATNLKGLIPDNLTYDQVLEDTALLVTDYSSIAYSAFYRGSNVIFCFQELDVCMEHYGGHLMLNEHNIFGDISYEYRDLEALIKKNYLKPQSDIYLSRYREIVEFHDGKNAERLIERLEEDGFVAKN